MFQTYKTTLTSKTQLTEDVFLFNFSLHEPQELSFVAGQYMMLAVPQLSGQSISRLYSISSSENNKQAFELMVKIIPNGIAGRYLSTLTIGDAVDFRGPAGVFTMRESPRSKIYLVTGTGLAPVWSMIASKKAGDIPQYLLWGLPNIKDLYFLDKLKEEKQQNPNFRFTVCLSREANLDAINEGDKENFFIGRITSGLENLIVNNNLNVIGVDYYLCSGREIIESLKTFVKEKGAPEPQIYFEKF